MKVSTISGTRVGIYRNRMEKSGEWGEKRSRQQVAWMWDMLQQRMMDALKSNRRTADRLNALEAEVRDGKTAVSLAVDETGRTDGTGRMTADTRKTILVTGFTPFPGAPVNPTEQLMQSLPERLSDTLSGVRCEFHVLPTTWAGRQDVTEKLRRELQPDAIRPFRRRRHAANDQHRNAGGQQGRTSPPGRRG